MLQNWNTIFIIYILVELRKFSQSKFLSPSVDFKRSPFFPMTLWWIGRPTDRRFKHNEWIVDTSRFYEARDSNDDDCPTETKWTQRRHGLMGWVLCGGRQPQYVARPCTNQQRRRTEQQYNHHLGNAAWHQNGLWNLGSGCLLTRMPRNWSPSLGQDCPRN